MPSPRKPTTWPLALQRLDDALLVRRRQAGEKRGLLGRRRQVLVAHLLDLAAEQRSDSVGMPTSRQTLRLTRSLSPVSTLTATPCLRRAAIAGRAVSLGGSRNAR